MTKSQISNTDTIVELKQSGYTREPKEVVDPVI